MLYEVSDSESEFTQLDYFMKFFSGKVEKEGFNEQDCLVLMNELSGLSDASGTPVQTDALDWYYLAKDLKELCSILGVEYGDIDDIGEYARDAYEAESGEDWEDLSDDAKRKFVKSHGGEVAKAVIEAAEDGGDKVWERTKGEGWIVYSQP